MNHLRPRISTTPLLLGIIVLIGLAVRCVYLASILDAPDFRSPVLDPQLNDYWARALISGDWTPPPHADNPEIRTTPYGRPPAYPWLLAGIYRLFNGNYLAPRIVQLLAGLANILLVFLLGRRLYGDKAGLVSALMMALYWSALYFEGELNSPAWEVLLSLGALNLLLRWSVTRSAWLLAAAGACLGFGALMRPNLLLPGMALLCWVFWKARSASRSFGGFKSAAVFLAAVMVVVVPVIARNWIVSREFVLISYYGGINAYIGNNADSEGTAPDVPDLYDISGVDKWNCFNYPSIVRGLSRHLQRPDFGFSDASRYFYQRALAFWREQPLDALVLTLRKAWFFWGPHEISDSKVVYYERRHAALLSSLPGFTHYAALALVGIIAVFFHRAVKGRKIPDAAPLLLLFSVFFFLSILPFFIADRYRFPVIPVLLPFAGYALCEAFSTLREKRFKAALALLSGMALSYAALAFPVLPYAPDYSTWQLHRGIAAAARGGTDTALEYFTEALRANPRNDEAHLHLGYLHAGQGRHDAAMNHYREAVKANPDNVIANNNLGYEYFLNGDLDLAEKHYRQALSRQPIYTLALNNLGNTLLRKGSLEDSLRCFEAALNINPRDPFARYNIGNAYLETKAYDKAVEAYQAAFNDQPFNPDIANNLGLALARSGNLKTSIEWFERALSLSPDYPLAHFNLGNVYGDMGDVTAACMHYQKTLDAWPEHEEARKRRETLCGDIPTP